MNLDQFITSDNMVDHLIYDCNSPERRKGSATEYLSNNNY